MKFWWSSGTSTAHSITSDTPTRHPMANLPSLKKKLFDCFFFSVPSLYCISVYVCTLIICKFTFESCFFFFFKKKTKTKVVSIQPLTRWCKGQHNVWRVCVGVVLFVFSLELFDFPGTKQKNKCFVFYFILFKRALQWRCWKSWSSSIQRQQQQ